MHIASQGSRLQLHIFALSPGTQTSCWFGLTRRGFRGGAGRAPPPLPPFGWNISKRFIRKRRKVALKSQIPAPPFLEFGFRPPLSEISGSAPCSPEVLKGSHNTGSMRARFYICVPRTHYKFKNAFLGGTLCEKMHDFCVNAIPASKIPHSDIRHFWEAAKPSKLESNHTPQARVTMLRK